MKRAQESSPNPGSGKAIDDWSLSAAMIGGSLMLLTLLLSFAEDPISGHQQKGNHAILASVALVLVVCWRKLGPRLGRGLLILLLTVSVANVLRWSPKRFEHIDRHDVACYYLGAKYAPEIGVFGLYPAVVAVDQEHRRYAQMKEKYWAQSREGFRRARLTHAQKVGLKYKEKRFSEARWKEFEHDVLYIQRLLGKSRFRGFLHDKGFNATPGWLLYAHPLVNATPVEELAWLTRWDLYLLGSAFALIGVTFGLDALLWVLLFFCVTISTKWLIPGSIILRYDWVSFLLLGMCFVKRGWNALAGAVTGLAGLSRIFPVVWMYGPAARLTTILTSDEKGSRLKRASGLLVMVFAFAATAVVLETAALSKFGTELAVDQAIKMKDHTSPSMISSKRPGLAIALSYDGEVERPRMDRDQRKRIVTWAPVRNVIAALILLTLGWALRRKSNFEAYAYGYMPFFLLSTGTYYYHIARVTLVLLHAFMLAPGPSRKRPPNVLRHQVGLAFLFALEIHSNLMFYYFDDQEVFWNGWLSRALTLYCVAMTLWIHFESNREEKRENASIRPPESSAGEITS